MAALSIALLGGMQVMRGGEPLTGFESAKVRALLAYLAVERAAPQLREALAGLLWPDMGQQQAMTNLRRALSNLREVLGDRETEERGGEPVLLVSSGALQFNPAAECALDVAAVDGALASAAPAAWEAAAALYRGDLLAGFSLAGCPEFEEWLTTAQERARRGYRELLQRLIVHHLERAAYPQAEAYARRMVELDSWDEEAHRLLMRALALDGRRAEALREYDALAESLQQELGVEPSPQTGALRKRIAAGEPLATDESLPRPAHGTPARAPAPDLGPAFDDMAFAGAALAEPAPFAGREAELARLDAALEKALSGQGQVVLISGEPGSGKTALAREFARRAMGGQPDLLAAFGACNAYAGLGEPYLPFVEALNLLAGDVTAASGGVTRAHAERLWHALPTTLQALLVAGPDLMGIFVPGETLLSRARAYAALDASRLAALEEAVDRRSRSAGPAPQQSLLSQYARVLRQLARSHPLVLVLDDLQWADAASIGLLLQVASHLQGSRILLLGCYRPAEVVAGRGDERHPLDKALHELQRAHGEITLDLDAAPARALLDALVDLEPNRLGEPFREELLRATEGNALFLIEMLQGLKERGALRRDAGGRWAAAAALDYRQLPPRVEAVIAERIERLSPELADLLRAASVQGETFYAEALAQVASADLGATLRHLGEALGRQGRLVGFEALRSLGDGGQRLSVYRFRHHLIQRYLYEALDPPARAVLHERTAEALASLHGGGTAEIAATLAWHLEEAGRPTQALEHLEAAAARAQALSGYQEAAAHLRHALALNAALPHGEQREARELRLQLALGTTLWPVADASHGEVRAAYRRAWELAQAQGDRAQAFRALWGLAASHLAGFELERAQALGERCLALADELRNADLQLEAHVILGMIFWMRGRPIQAREQMEATQTLYDVERHREEALHFGLDPGVYSAAILASAVSHLGYLDQAVDWAKRAVALADARDLPTSRVVARAHTATLYYDVRQEPQAAGEPATEMLAIAQRHAVEPWLPQAHAWHARKLASEGRRREALAELERALDETSAGGHEVLGPSLMLIAASAYGELDRPAEALALLARAAEAIEVMPETERPSAVYAKQGEFLLARDGPPAAAEAEALFRRALAIGVAKRSLYCQLEATLPLARLLEEQGRPAEARQLLGPLLRRFPEGHDTPLLQGAAALLASLPAG